MKVAVIFDHDMYNGGGYQAIMSVIIMLQEKACGQHDFIFFTIYPENHRVLGELGIKVHLLKRNAIDAFCVYLRHDRLLYSIWKKIFGQINTRFEKMMCRHKVDLIYFPSPSELALHTNCHNYIYTLWDQCHRDHPEFPEIHNEFNEREYIYNDVLRRSVAVITESELSRENAMRRYGLDAERVIAIPLLLSKQASSLSDNTIDIIKKYEIGRDFIFYPAQFWSHKNHIYILKGIKFLKDQYDVVVYALFAGSDKGNQNHVREIAIELGIDDQVRFLGFVDASEIPALYRNALALVMPTYFGNSNLPPLEAFAMDCPVLYSDMLGMREQTGDAVLYLDLKDPQTLSELIYRLINENGLREELISKGKQKLKDFSEDILWDHLKKIFDDYEIKMNCWK